jgi:hypothetical protein
MYNRDAGRPQKPNTPGGWKEMPGDKLRLRFFFDAGSGTCLWADNDAARERFVYAVDPDELPLPTRTRERLHALLRRYDESFDPDYPPGPPSWSEEESAQFKHDASELLDALRTGLGPDFEIVDESRL